MAFFDTLVGLFSSGSGFGGSGAVSSSFVDVTGTTQDMTAGVIYYANNAALVTFTLPAQFNQNDVFTVIGKGAGGWRITQRAGQIIHGATNTTVGTGGYIASQARYDAAFLRASIANTDLIITNKQGTLTSV